MKATTQKKQKISVKRIAILIITILLAIYIAICVNIQQQHEQIACFLENLGEISSISVVEGDETREEFVQKYAEDTYFKKTIFSELTSYENMGPAEDGDRWEGFISTVNLVSNLKVLGYTDSDMEDILEQFAMDELTRYMEKNDFEALAKTIALLDKHKVENKNVRQLFQTCLRNIQEEVFAGNGQIDMYDYIRIVNNQLDGSNYTTILECYPYDAMIAYINQKGQQVVTEAGRGGFYDDLKDEYTNESYWVDPLMKTRNKKGEVGTYQYTEENQLFGDFRVNITSKYWYGTAKDDSNNSLTARLYYQDKTVMSDYQKITTFLRKITSENCYHVLTENGYHIFFVLGRNQITVLGHTLFTIAYE